MKHINTTTILCIGLLLMGSCGEFLDEKPRKSLAVPATLVDFQAILEHPVNLTNFDPVEGQISSDGFYIPADLWNSMPETERRLHLWENDHVFQEGINSWYWAYNNIYRANTVLDNLKDQVERSPINQTEWDNVKGQAHFLRGKLFFQAASVWCLAYDDEAADMDLGLPLRLSANFQEESIRATLRETYEQVQSDLKAAAYFLPNHAVHVIRPSKQAAYGLLARVYLAMRDYEKASLYADSCLMLGDGLLDYNELDTMATYPIPQYNKEVLVHSIMNMSANLGRRARVASDIYKSYAANDLRKKLLFIQNTDGSVSFRGNYSGTSGLFSGIALNEVYLIKAEAAVRSNDPETATDYLKRLLVKRHEWGTLEDFDADSPGALLNKILKERRKELLFTGLRWMDIKRLNKEGYNINIEREINGDHFKLLSNSPRFAIPIPHDVVALGQIEQNTY